MAAAAIHLREQPLAVADFLRVRGVVLAFARALGDGRRAAGRERHQRDGEMLILVGVQPGFFLLPRLVAAGEEQRRGNGERAHNHFCAPGSSNRGT
jgi:hypothetical protein